MYEGTSQLYILIFGHVVAHFITGHSLISATVLPHSYK